MTDCEKFGMTNGCQDDCPQLQRGECEQYESVEVFLKEWKMSYEENLYQHKCQQCGMIFTRNGKIHFNCDDCEAKNSKKGKV